MEYPNLEFLTDIELVLLQSEARKFGDQEFVNAILIKLDKRQKNNSTEQRG